jgi:hypothetical protein
MKKCEEQVVESRRRQSTARDNKVCNSRAGDEVLMSASYRARCLKYRIYESVISKRRSKGGNVSGFLGG